MSPLSATLQDAPCSHPSNQSLPRHPFSSWSQVDSMKMVSVPLMERLECSRSLSISLLNEQVGIVLAVLLLQLHSVLQRISIESSWWRRLSQQSRQLAGPQSQHDYPTRRSTSAYRRKRCQVCGGRNKRSMEHQARIATTEVARCQRAWCIILKGLTGSAVARRAC